MGNRSLLVGVAAVMVILLFGTVYVALYSDGPDQANGTTQTQTTGTVASSNGTARIEVSGTGTVSYVPDEAVVTFGVVTENATVSAATASNAAATSSIIRALNSIGIANGSMQTQAYTIAPEYSYASEGKDSPPSIDGYVVTDMISVNVTDAASCVNCMAGTLGQRAGQVIDAGTSAGANQVSFGFAVSEHLASRLQKQALQQAVLDASSQATVIAGAMGVTITGVIQATDAGAFLPQVETPGVMTQGSAAPATSILPGTSTISASVEITYSIG